MAQPTKRSPLFKLVTFVVTSVIAGAIGLWLTPKTIADAIQQNQPYNSLFWHRLYVEALNFVTSPSSVAWFAAAVIVWFCWAFVPGIRWRDGDYERVSRIEYFFRTRGPLLAGVVLDLAYRLNHLQDAPRGYRDLVQDRALWWLASGIAVATAINAVVVKTPEWRESFEERVKRVKWRLERNDWIWANWRLLGNATSTIRNRCECSEFKRLDGGHECPDGYVPERLWSEAKRRGFFSRYFLTDVPRSAKDEARHDGTRDEDVHNPLSVYRKAHPDPRSLNINPYHVNRYSRVLAGSDP